MGFCSTDIVLPHHMEKFRADPQYFEKNPHAVVENEECVRKFCRYWGQHVGKTFYFCPLKLFAKTGSYACCLSNRNIAGHKGSS